MMKNEKVDIATLSLPDELTEWVGNAPVYESSGESGARTVYIDGDECAYLKIAEAGTLFLSAQMQRYFAKHNLSSQVLQYISADRDYMITSALKGEDGITKKYLAEPEQLSEVFGHSLRALHEVDHRDCPVVNRMHSLTQMAETGSFLQTHLDDIAAYIGKANANNAAEEVKAMKGLLKNDVLIHGDYCLPNIILNHWEFAGFIDVADGGVGDRHYDLAWGLWTLKRNLKSSKYGQRFLDAYGREFIDRDRLRICGLLASID